MPSETAEYDAWNEAALTRVLSAVAQVEATLLVAHALAVAGRRLDLTGLDTEIGKLCAGLLDLPAEKGRTLRIRLVAIRADLDRLSAVLAPPSQENFMP